MRIVSLPRVISIRVGIGLGLAGFVACERPPPPSVVVPVPVSPEEDRRQAVQALLASPWIESALGPSSENAPPSALVVVSLQPLPGAGLLAFGQPVKVLTPHEAQAQRPETYLELTAIRLAGDQAVIAFRSDSQEISGEAQLRRTSAGWRVDRVAGSQR